MRTMVRILVRPMSTSDAPDSGGGISSSENGNHFAGSPPLAEKSICACFPAFFRTLPRCILSAASCTCIPFFTSFALSFAPIPPSEAAAGELSGEPWACVPIAGEKPWMRFAGASSGSHTTTSDPPEDRPGSHRQLWAACW